MPNLGFLTTTVTQNGKINVEEDVTGIPWQVAPKIARFLENVNDDLMVSVRGMTSYDNNIQQASQ